jgi:hypothetical protein
MKAWQTLLALLFVAACSRLAIQQKPESQPVPTGHETAQIKLAPAKPELPSPPPVPKSPEVDFNEDEDALAARRARDKAARVQAAQAGARRLQQVDLRSLHQLAAQGDINAQVDLGLICFEGQRVPKNLSHARHWWTLAAQRGHPVAQANLHLLNPGDPPGEVSFFGTPGKGRRFIFIIDRSGSMGVNRLQAAKSELLKTLQKLPAGSQFMIYFFDHGAEPMPVSGLLTANPRTIAWAGQWVRAREAGGGTDPSQALKWALELRPDTVWLLSDGRFAHDEAILKQLARDNPRQAARINTLAFHDRSGEPALRAIAKANGGTYRFVAP